MIHHQFGTSITEKCLANELRRHQTFQNFPGGPLLYIAMVSCLSYVDGHEARDHPWLDLGRELGTLRDAGTAALAAPVPRNAHPAVCLIIG
jgi:hypothetical protein